MTSIKELESQVKKFAEDRDWDQFHDPTHLAIGLITESSELLEHFRFKSKEEALALFHDPKKRVEIEDECADVLFFLLRFAQKNNIDLVDAFNKKLAKTEKKYPIEKVKGLNKKYDEY